MRARGSLGASRGEPGRSRPGVSFLPRPLGFFCSCLSPYFLRSLGGQVYGPSRGRRSVLSVSLESQFFFFEVSSLTHGFCRRWCFTSRCWEVFLLSSCCRCLVWCPRAQAGRRMTAVPSDASGWAWRRAEGRSGLASVGRPRSPLWRALRRPVSICGVLGSSAVGACASPAPPPVCSWPCAHRGPVPAPRGVSSTSCSVSPCSPFPDGAGRHLPSPHAPGHPGGR